MDLRKIKKLIDLLEESNLAEIEIKEGEESVRLATLQADAVKQERQATFGRIAAGLVHDLAHPIQNIGNNCKLMLKMYEDPEYRPRRRKVSARDGGCSPARAFAAGRGRAGRRSCRLCSSATASSSWALLSERTQAARSSIQRHRARHLSRSPPP